MRRRSGGSPELIRSNPAPLIDEAASAWEGHRSSFRPIPAPPIDEAAVAWEGHRSWFFDSIGEKLMGPHVGASRGPVACGGVEELSKLFRPSESRTPAATAQRSSSVAVWARPQQAGG
jgi:hypothetical protein